MELGVALFPDARNGVTTGGCPLIPFFIAFMGGFSG